MKEKRIFGELEQQVLHVIDEQKAATVKQVQEALGGQDAYTTIMTVMSRLAEKGELSREKQGRQYYYYSISKEAKPGLLARLKERLFGGESFAMINYLIDSSDDLSPDELEELIKKIKEKQ